MKTTAEKTGTTMGSGLNKVPDTCKGIKIEQQKPNGLPLGKAFETREMDAGLLKAENPVQAIGGAEQSAAKEAIKVTENEAAKTEKIALNLESTLKLVEDLHRRKIQRDRLLETMQLLEAFEIAQQEDAEETDSNHFQGCVLTIEDDERRKFSTKNSVIILAVTQFVNQMCTSRLTEIEAGIIIPA